MKVKLCPYCQSAPIFQKKPLWNIHTGGGYSGCYDIYLECGNDKCRMHPETKRYNTIYNDEEVAKGDALADWNWRDGEEEDA